MDSKSLNKVKIVTPEEEAEMAALITTKSEPFDLSFIGDSIEPNLPPAEIQSLPSVTPSTPTTMRRRTSLVGGTESKSKLSLAHSLSHSLSEYLPTSNRPRKYPDEKSEEELIEKPSEEPKRKNCLRRYLGIILALFCSMLMSLSTFVVTVLDREGIGPSYSFFFRSVGMTIISIPLLIGYFLKGEKIFEGIWPLSVKEHRKNYALMIIRCLLGVSSIILQYYAIENLSLGDSAVIIYSNPVFVTFFAYIVLKEPCGIIPTITAIVTIIGVIITAQPPFIFGEDESHNDPNKDHTKGVLLALASMLLNAFIIVLLRFLRGIHYIIISFYFSILGIIFATILSLALNDFETKIARPEIVCPLFVLLGILAFVAQLLLILALKFEEAGPVAIVRTCDIIFSFIWEMMIGKYPDMYSLIGASIVICCVVLIGCRKYLIELKPESKLRKTFFCLLK